MTPPARSIRAKTISRQGILGQRGINLIEDIVLQMGSHWTPAGPNEVGVDGFIEFFDPTSKEALGVRIAVQSKAVTAFENDSSGSFEFWCEPRDLEYWLLGTMPIILIVSKPASKEAYWIHIQDYFSAYSKGGSTRVKYNREVHRFGPQSFAALLKLGSPTDRSFYLPPIPKRETIQSNLLQVISFPANIWTGATEFRTHGQIWAVLKDAKTRIDGNWIMHNKSVYSFQDLSTVPWHPICDQGTVERHDSQEWSQTDDPSRMRQFVQLLNRSLSSQLWPRIKYWPSEDCFAMATKSKSGGRVPYRSLKKQSRISAVTLYSKKVDDRTYVWYRHLAFRGQFRRINDSWYLEITPTYRFTYDGFNLDRFHESRLMTIKRFEGNRAVLSSVLYWAHELCRQRDIFLQESLPLSFGELLTFESQVGIDDAEWQANDAQIKRPPDVTDDLFFAGIDSKVDQ
jgi:hypothetical protein